MPHHRHDRPFGSADRSPMVTGSVAGAAAVLITQVERVLTLAVLPWECGLEHLGSLRALRAKVREHLVGVSPEVLADVLVVTNELVTNAVRHTRSPRRLRVAREGCVVRVEVSDGDSALPVLHPPSTTRLGGRGILLVHEMSRAWGVLSDPDGDGKIVWAELAEHR